MRAGDARRHAGASQPNADLGVRTVSGRHDHRVLPGRRGGTAAGWPPAHPRLRRLRHGPVRPGRRDGGHLRGIVAAHGGVRVSIQFRRTRRADPELDPGQRAAGHDGSAGPAGRVDHPRPGRVPLAYQVSWTELQFFNPASPPPAGVSVVERSWPAGQPAQASWPHAPAGWRVVATNQAGRWVLWREGLTGIPGLAADRAPVAVAGAWILMRVRTGEFLAWVALARFCERGQHPSRGRYSR